MAIITEERQSSVGLVSIVVWLLILALIGSGTYYIFFRQPTVEGEAVNQSDEFKKADVLSKVDLSASSTRQIMESLSSMKDYIPWREPKEQGRENPFQPI